MAIKQVSVNRTGVDKLFHKVNIAKAKQLAKKSHTWPSMIDVYADVLNASEGWSLVSTERTILTTGGNQIKQIWLHLLNMTRISITNLNGYLVDIEHFPYTKQYPTTVYRGFNGQEGEFVPMGYGVCTYCGSPNGEEYLLNVGVGASAIEKLLGSENLIDRWTQVVNLGLDSHVKRNRLSCPCHNR